MVRRNPCLLPPHHALILAALILAVPPVRGQQPAPPAAPPQGQGEQPLPKSPPTPSGQEEKPKSLDTSKEQTGTSNERLFWVIPDFLLIEDARPLPPLSTGAKFKVVARNSFDYAQIPLIGLIAGIGQAENDEPGYGQGAAGYGKRYGLAFADRTIQSFMTGAILPSILRQDPRYYRLGQGGFWRRTAYGASRIVICRGDSGRAQFDYSEVFGSALSSGISVYTYHPRGERTVGKSLNVWGTQIGFDSLAGVFNEFWPDIHRHFSKK
jgi:hypothetical protein